MVEEVDGPRGSGCNVYLILIAAGAYVYFFCTPEEVFAWLSKILN